MRVLVFGDSISQGFFDKNGGWVASLERHYHRDGFVQGSDFKTFFNLSISGDFSRNVLKRLDSELEAREWPGEDKIIIFAIGTNDSHFYSDGKNEVEVDIFTENIIKIIDIAKRFGTKILFVGLSPVVDAMLNPSSWNSDICFSTDRIKLFNDIIAEVSTKNNVEFVDIHSRFVALSDREVLFEDGLHPNAAGHELIYKTVLPQLDNLLEQS